jgi:hypothetical protein
VCLGALAALVLGGVAAARDLGPIREPALPEAAAPRPAPVGHVRLPVVSRLEPVRRALDEAVPRDLRNPMRVDTTSVDELDRTPEKRGGPGHGPDDVHEPDPANAPYEGPVPWRGMLRRGPWMIGGTGDSLALLTRLQYSVDILLPGRMAARCGSAAEPWGGLTGCVGRVAWGDGWVFESRTRAIPNSFEKRCKPRPPGLNFTRRLNVQVDARLAAVLPAALDSAMRKRTDATRRVREALSFLAEPVPLDSGAWLRWNVGRVTVDPPRLSGDSITAEVSFEVRPAIVPAAGDPAAPALGEPNVRLSGDAVHVPYHCWVEYAEVERSIRAARETSGSAEGSGLTVQAARVRGARDRVRVSVDLAGPVRGTAYLVGTLAMSQPGYRLHSPDLDWSPESRRRLRSALSGTAARALESELEQVRQDVRQAFDRRLESCLIGWERALLQALRADLDQPAAASAGFNRREVTGIFCTDRAIGVQVVTSGRVRILLSRPD